MTKNDNHLLLNVLSFKFEFIGADCFRDQEYYGNIMTWKKTSIVVKVNQGNKFTDGKIITFNY